MAIITESQFLVLINQGEQAALEEYHEAVRKVNSYKILRNEIWDHLALNNSIVYTYDKKKGTVSYAALEKKLIGFKK